MRACTYSLAEKWLKSGANMNTLYIKGHSSVLTEVVAFKDAALLPTCSKLWGQQLLMPEQER